MKFRPVIFIGRQRGFAHDLIGVLELTQIEQLAGEYPPLAPPLIGVLQRHRPGRSRQRHTGGVGIPIVPHHPANAAQRVAQILAGLG